ncbi:tetratricopeptide repeat protein [Paenibacillus sp. N1-5-1-14]|nr:tetratricopeptide repeat protein [Paenibacillus radicibacter]MCR8643343.1 tetratricopeptide repeat protein [Paenibacillus radicibacter]
MRKKRVTANAATTNTNVIPVRMDATFFFERAVQSLDRYHYDKALKYFRRTVEYEKDNPVNYHNLAGVLSEMGKYEESNQVLTQVVEQVDPAATECYFYMANNYSNMERFDLAEKAIIQYLENDPKGLYLDESEEMLEMLTYELERAPKVTRIKAREGLFEHDHARELLEAGKFGEALRTLEAIVEKDPEFLAARNNLALAYYYTGQFDQAVDTIHQVLTLEPGNLHGLCNLAIFSQHLRKEAEVREILQMLQNMVPLHPDHMFKLATTMGILGDHATAYSLFKRLLKYGEGNDDPCLYHYTAVAASNIGYYVEAKRLWLQAEKLDPKSDVAPFYLQQMKELEAGRLGKLHYHYHLPFEEQFRLIEKASSGVAEHLKEDPLVRSSFFWGLRHGDKNTKLQVIQAFGLIGDKEVRAALLEFVLEPDEEDAVKKAALFVLRSIGVEGPIKAYLDGSLQEVTDASSGFNLPVWEPKWQTVMEVAYKQMHKRYDLIQQHDLETLWVDFLSRVYPNTPRIAKIEGWSAALEYWIAKMHRKAITYQEVADRYGTTVTTVSKNVKLIDEVCGLKQKMAALWPKYLDI